MLAGSNEEELLIQFLLGIELQDSITLQQFTELFPLAYKNNNQIKDLYRAYQISRSHVREVVKKNISVEVNMESSLIESITLPLSKEHTDTTLTLTAALDELSIAEAKLLKDINILEKLCQDYIKDFQNLDQVLGSVARRVPSKSPPVTDPVLISQMKELVQFCNDL